MRIEARRIGADDRQENAAATRSIGGVDGRDRQPDHDRERNEDGQRKGPPGACRHP